MDRYAVINEETGEVINVIAWDGLTNWSPPNGHSVMRSEECSRGDFWDEKRNDFIRTLKNIKPPEDEVSINERKAMYSQSKERLRMNASFLVIDDTGKPESL